MSAHAVTESRHVVCPGCGALNRLPGDRPAGAANCGVCKAKLFAGTPTDVNGAAFDRHLNRDELPLLVDVWASWCGPCRAMAPEFHRAAGMLEPHVRLLKVNADEEPEISARYGIRGIPALLLFREGRLVAQTAGAMSAQRIAQWAQANL